MARYRLLFTGFVYGDTDTHTQLDRLINMLTDSPLQDVSMKATAKNGKFSVEGWIEAEDRDLAMDIACSWEAKVESAMWVEIVVKECELA